jgi:tetratricopeptide (TPR) repeat protein
LSEALYERYKDALRRGHLATLRGRHDAALAAYVEAATIAPERALPHTSIGTVSLRVGRPADALTAFDHALDRAPNDEGAAGRRRRPRRSIVCPSLRR